MKRSQREEKVKGDEGAKGDTVYVLPRHRGSESYHEDPDCWTFDAEPKPTTRGKAQEVRSPCGICVGES